MNKTRLEELGKNELDRQKQFTHRIFGCSSTACVSAGARSTLEILHLAVKASCCTEDEVEVVNTGCMGLCSRGPLVRIETAGEEPVLYGDVTPEIALKIVARHLPVDAADADKDCKELGEEEAAELFEIREELIKSVGVEDLDEHVISLDIPFFTRQEKVVLSNTGYTDPEKLEDYLAHGGYQALIKVLEEYTPEQVCKEILDSGLRGRGGAGFPTGLKWDLTRKQQAEHKYVIVNGDEGDPGAYMDRTVMEDDPHRVLEGMIIAAYAVGADHGYLYIRGEYPVAVDRINQAIRDARRRKILGRSVLGTDFSFTAEVRIGAGAFVCGEETALMHSVEGKRGAPRMRPPYPAESGIFGYPTNINNVETMANIPSIILRGADWFAAIGTEKSKGTKVFALAGQLRQTGLIEVPMGITLRDIVFEIGDGIPGGKAFKAAQTGGPSGGCIPEQFLDEPVDYENLKRLGSIMGSGGLVIIDETTRMPEFARFFMDFCVDESCGKCVPCRIGTVQIRNLLDKIIHGNGTLEDLEKLDKLCPIVQKSSLCGLGQSAPNPVISTLKYFRHEYEELIQVPETEET